MSSTLYHAPSFVISSGTVTLDLQRSRVLFILWQNKSNSTPELLLPKGRKNVGESLEATALRETWEETGHRVSLLPLPVPTRATSSSELEGRERWNTEPVCVTERDREGVRKIIFWFAAGGDSSAVPEERVVQEGEEFESVWVGFDEAEERITHDADREVLGAVLRLVKSIGQ